MTAVHRRCVLEGIPGSGKSTAFGRAIMAAPECLALAETNPSPTQWAALKDVDEVARSSWFLERAAVQLRAARSAVERFHFVISDKGPLSVLSFAYATCGPDGPEYAEVEHAYRRVVGDLCEGELALVLMSSVDDSLTRRTLKRERKGYPWYDPTVLERLIAFYEEVAPGLHPDVVFVRTSGTPLAETLEAAGKVLGVALAGVELPQPSAHDERFYPMTGQRIEDDEVWEFFAREGGSDELGQPVTPLMPYHGHRVQFFERGAIRRDGAGARYWDGTCLVPGDRR